MKKMLLVTGPSSRTLLLLVCWVLLPASKTLGQQQPPSPQTDDVVRVKTELVQTDVMVFDQKGRFVDDLQPELFKVSLDGQPRKISIFERVISGSKFEASQVATARTGSPAPAGKTVPVASPTSGRLIFFFVDDVHLGGESMVRARSTLLRFVDSGMNPGDKVAIVSTSGQIGFLQQLTDHPAVLRTAISRLNYKRNPEGYAGKTRITEYMASEVEDSHNSKLFAYLMESVKLEYAMTSGARRGDHGNNSTQSATTLLKSRIGQISAQSKIDTRNTIAALRGVMQSAAALPGRKLVFFLSDGFVVDPRGSNALSLLQHATELAARSNAVIYSIDMRGSFGDASIDASSNDHVDMGSRHAGISVGETTAPRAPLNLLADKTGGRTIVNSSELNQDIEQAVRETSEYYVLAWRPDSENERNATARLEVTIPGRPDLKVRLRRSYFVSPGPTAGSGNAKTPTAANVTPEAQLLAALASGQPMRTLPASLSVGYVMNAESGMVLQASMQVAREAFDFDPAIAGQKSEVDVMGAAIDDRGLIYSFKQVVTVTPQPTPETPQAPVVWNQHLKVRPGLYQVRVAVRERLSGRTGSAIEWIEIPSPERKSFSMSSLFLGERPPEPITAGKPADGPQPIRVRADHRFARTSVLRFQTYIYHASRNAGAPDVWINARVLRGNQMVLRVATSKIPADVAKDPVRISYWSEIALQDLGPGFYTLQVSATDRSAGATASQSITFSVE